jgi:membrane protein DedA with SNARE-associated domain
VDQLLSILIFKGYVLFFLWILANRMGVPVPATPALLAAGALAGMGEWRIVLVLLLAVVATLVSDTVWFELGRRYGRRILRVICRITFQPESFAQRTEKLLERHGARSLLITKFIPGMNRTVLPLTGSAQIGLPRFLAFDFFGALFWAGAYSGLGYIFSDTLEVAVRHAATLSWYAAALLALAILAGYGGWRYLLRGRA